MSEKTNARHLKDILTKLQDDKIGEAARNKLFEEADEFIGAMEEKEQLVTTLENDLEAAEEKLKDFEDEEPNWDTVELGLDTFYWSLNRDNLAIQQEVESFVNRLRKKYIGVTE